MKGTYSRHLLSAQPPSPHRMMPTDLVAQQPTESGCPEDGGTEADPEELARLSGGHCRADEMLVSDPALGNVSPLSAGEEVKPRNAGHRRQSVTVTGRRLLPKSVTCLQPGSVKIEGVSSGKTESHAHKAEALSGSLQDGRTPTDRGSPPEEKPPAFGDEKLRSPGCSEGCPEASRPET